jgi:hypothetical protein
MAAQLLNRVRRWRVGFIVPMSEAREGGRVFDISRADLRAAEAKALQRIRSRHLTGQVKIRDQN